MSTQTAPDLVRAARLFHALSDPTRLEILRRLGGGERCVCELTDALDAQQPRLSYHLRTLKEAGLVLDRKDGRWVHYRVAAGALDEVAALVGEFRPEARERWGEAGGACCG